MGAVEFSCFPFLFPGTRASHKSTHCCTSEQKLQHGKPARFPVFQSTLLGRGMRAPDLHRSRLFAHARNNSVLPYMLIASAGTSQSPLFPTVQIISRRPTYLDSKPQPYRGQQGSEFCSVLVDRTKYTRPDGPPGAIAKIRAVGEACKITVGDEC